MLNRKLLISLRFSGMADGVADGTRTHDDQNHNLGLYQLSYSHRRTANYSPGNTPAGRTCQRAGTEAASAAASAADRTSTL